MCNKAKKNMYKLSISVIVIEAFFLSCGVEEACCLVVGGLGIMIARLWLRFLDRVTRCVLAQNTSFHDTPIHLTVKNQ